MTPPKLLDNLIAANKEHFTMGLAIQAIQNKQRELYKDAIAKNCPVKKDDLLIHDNKILKVYPSDFEIVEKHPDEYLVYWQFSCVQSDMEGNILGYHEPVTIRHGSFIYDAGVWKHISPDKEVDVQEIIDWIRTQALSIIEEGEDGDPSTLAKDHILLLHGLGKLPDWYVHERDVPQLTWYVEQLKKAQEKEVG